MQKNQTKEFVIGVADCAFFHNDQLLFTGTTNVTTSLEAAMESNDIRAGKGNKLLYSHKYGRTLTATIESVEWNLAYFALQTGSAITQAVREVLEINACVDIVEGIGVLPSTPAEGTDIFCVLPDGAIVSVKASGTTIDLTDKQVTSGVIQATYVKNVMTNTASYR